MRLDQCEAEQIVFNKAVPLSAMGDLLLLISPDIDTGSLPRPRARADYPSHYTSRQ